MSDIKMVDITFHIDKETDDATRAKVESDLRQVDGVVSVHMPEDERHLVVVEYNADTTTSSDLLATVQGAAGHAEMIGL